MKEITKLPQESVLKWVPRLEKQGLIRTVGPKRMSRANRPVLLYELTDNGAALLGWTSPDIQRSDINPQYVPKYEEGIAQSRLRRISALDKWLPLLRHVAETGKAAPDTTFRLEITTNKEGMIDYYAFALGDKRYIRRYGIVKDHRKGS